MKHNLGVTIVGLGQVGSSLGLALGQYPGRFRRTGLDKLLPVSGKARTLGAIDRVAVNLPAAVQDADIILLAVPVHALQETLAVIAPDVKAGALVLDMAPGKQQILRWRRELLPETVHYASVWPLLTAAGGRRRADLFAGGFWWVAEDGLTEPAWQATQALAALCGAAVRRMPAESLDRWIVRADVLPRLVSVGLLNATAGQPGWFDGRKLAARPYAALSAGMAGLEDDRALETFLEYLPDLAQEQLEALLQTLTGLRRQLDENPQGLGDWLENIRGEYLQTQEQPAEPGWTPDQALQILEEIFAE
jgi:prephenate dehydrogenase